MCLFIFKYIKYHTHTCNNIATFFPIFNLQIIQYYPRQVYKILIRRALNFTSTELISKSIVFTMKI